MKKYFTLETLFATGLLLFLLSACNGKDQDLIDSITGKTGGVPVTGVSLDKASLELKVGDSETLTATVAPEDATNKNVSWTSGDATIATVENGRVTAVKPGSVTITAKTEDGGRTAECAVTVKTNLAPSVTVGSENVSALSVVLQGKANLDSSVPSDLMVGFQYSLSQGILPSNSTTVEATDADAKYNYSTGITGLKPGTTYYFRSIVRMSGNNHYGETMSFTTKPLSTMLETKEASDIAPTSAKMNAKLNLTDVQYTTMDYGFYWGTSEDSQTTYVKGGEIAGNAYFASLNDLSHKTQYWYKAYLKVDGQEFYGVVKTFTTDVVPVKGVTLDKTACTVHTIDSTFTLTATINPADATNKAVNWKSSNTSVATVDANGKVTAKGNGSATITVTTDDQSKTATCEVTVAQWVTGITLDKTMLTLNVGQTATLAPTVSPSNAKDKSVTWSSSNTAVATVDQNGQVTAVEKGETTIKATANDGSGKSASCSVTVNKLATFITLDKTAITLYNGKTETLTATVNPPEASNKDVTWGSSDTSVATVSNSGVVTGVSMGSATITATAKDGSGVFATCSVTVAQNLSASGSANCYVVSSAGQYSFRATKGNSSNSVGGVASAEVLWESYGTSTTPSVGSVISNVLCIDNDIFFSTPSTLHNGNAVIAAKDASGTILWSWHIWVCAGYNPASTAQEYYNSAGTMMDRNLGATSATPGDVGALGLLYQWGRKDPFLGGCQISYSSGFFNQTKAASTLSWPSAVSSTSSTGKVAYAVAHPTTFITGVIGPNYDWVYSSRDDKLWQSAKTIYDPCPPGWRVPAGGSSGVWSKAANTSSSFTRTWDDTNKGMRFSGKFGSAGTIWYPAAGALRYADGVLYYVGYLGLWWSCTPDDGYAYYLRLDNDGNVNPSGYGYRASGHSVRCLQE